MTYNYNSNFLVVYVEKEIVVFHRRLDRQSCIILWLYQRLLFAVPGALRLKDHT
jgi:hypothetical protein